MGRGAEERGGEGDTVGPAPDGSEVTLQREDGVRVEGRERRRGEGRGGGHGRPGSRWQ